ncbi:hypothetical protein G9A89_013963 [Geosiphon pyriformis]|nr:hypothetical protein G9A89_013963 [Geosiphon pyriformis]
MGLLFNLRPQIIICNTGVLSASNFAVEFRLASLESLVEPVGALVVLVTKLLSISPAVDVSVRKNMTGLAKQNKDLAAVAFIMQKKITHLEKKCKWACLEDASNDDNIVNDDDNNDEDFSVYNNTFDIMMHF